MRLITISIVTALVVAVAAAGMYGGYPMYGGGGYGGGGYGVGGFGRGGFGGLFSALIGLVFISFFFEIIGDLFDDDDDHYYKGGKKGHSEMMDDY